MSTAVPSCPSTLPTPHTPPRDPASTSPLWLEQPTDPTAIAAARRMVTLILEVWDGRRPAAHLDALLDPTAARYLRIVDDRLADDRRPARLCSMRVFHPHPRAVEIAAVFQLGRRPRALAARLERRSPSRCGGSGWRCRAIQLG